MRRFPAKPEKSQRKVAAPQSRVATPLGARAIIETVELERG
jgi:hypothetical protein